MVLYSLTTLIWLQTFFLVCWIIPIVFTNRSMVFDYMVLVCWTHGEVLIAGKWVFGVLRLGEFHSIVCFRNVERLYKKGKKKVRNFTRLKLLIISEFIKQLYIYSCEINYKAGSATACYQDIYIYLYISLSLGIPQRLASGLYTLSGGPISNLIRV